MTDAAKLFAEAKNAAGDHAVKAAKDGHFEQSREWVLIAIEADRLLRRSVALLSEKVAS